MGDRDDLDEIGPETYDQGEPALPEHDPKVEEARDTLEHFFDQRDSETFYERQLEVLFEGEFFHWITRKALYELHDSGYLAMEPLPLSETTFIKFYRHRRHRFWKRQADEAILLVRQFSNPAFTQALGRHGELMFDAALPTAGFMPKGRNISEYRDIRLAGSSQNLDRLFERDGVTYGAEIKNTLRYIPHDELRTKLAMCRVFGIRPLFIVRMAPKSYVEEVRRQGGFTLIFKYQLYPHGYAVFAATVREKLGLPVDTPASIADGTVQRFARWHTQHEES